MNHLFFGLTAGMTLSLQAQDKPNVLFIAVDDLKPLLGCYGQDYMITPHIDELAGNGVIFTNAHCQQAVSGPTRASLLTGMRPDYTGVWDLKTRMRDVNPDILAMPQYFKQQGYQTVAIGKIYDPRCVDEDYDRPSWSVPYAKSANYIYPEAYGEPAYSYYASAESKQIVARLEEEAREKGIREVRNYAIEKYKPSVECADYPDEAYQDGQICNNALSYMKEMAGSGEPFFLAVGFKRPHLPFSAPKKYWDLYDRDKVHLAEYQKAVKGGVDIAYHKHEELQSYTDIPKIESFSDIFTKLIPEDKQRELIHGYYACVSFIDAQVGKLMAELQELGLEKNTIVILWGDHGWHLGDHALWCKHTNFEQATRVPMIISVPGEQPGSYSMPVEFVDIFPTLCDAMGLDIPAHLQGKSLMPAIQDKNVRIKDFAVSQFDRGNNHGYTIRTDRYRFTVWMKDDYRTWMPFEADRVLDCEMYDYQTDPNETLNLYRLPEYEGLVNEMWERFTGFVKTQNQELAGAAPGKPKKKEKTRPQKTDAGIAFTDPLDQNWQVNVRKGAIAQFTVEQDEESEDNILHVVVDQLGENPWDLGMNGKGSIAMKKGQQLVLHLEMSGPEVKFILLSETGERVIQSLSGGKKMKNEKLYFRAKKTDNWNLRLQFLEKGDYRIKILGMELR